MMKTLSVKLPESLAKWLAGESKQTRRSRSELVREALEEKRNGPANGARRAKKPMTMAEAMEDLRGTISGPRDLSTNPKYFDDFGK
jgi:Arc/MetJ-type ribon-helix-helix transcriptional regulator